MHDTERSFREALTEAPDDDGLRHVFRDWLEEQGSARDQDRQLSRCGKVRLELELLRVESGQGVCRECLVEMVHQLGPAFRAVADQVTGAFRALGPALPTVGEAVRQYLEAGQATPSDTPDAT
jgi:uncharacterized protein (TIGR02996 family)